MPIYSLMFAFRLSILNTLYEAELYTFYIFVENNLQNQEDLFNYVFKWQSIVASHPMKIHGTMLHDSQK